jgi:Concanavalin A-like lectin/glucanases superfamily
MGDDATVHAYRGGGSWELVRRFGAFAHPATVHAGRLVLGMLQPATVWSFDGERWADLGNPLGDPDACDEIHSLTTFGGALHCGTWRLGRVARWDERAARWRQVGRLGDSTEIMALNVYNGMLYAASIPRAEVFRHERDRSWTSLRRLYAPPGWRPVLVRNTQAPPDGDRRMRDWTRVTSLTQHDGRLFASVGSCTSAAVDAPADVRGTVHALRAGVVATTPRTLTPGRHHVAAVRHGGTLTVHVDGSVAATAHGTVTGSIRTAAPLTLRADATGPFRGEIDRPAVHGRALTAREIAALADRALRVPAGIAHHQEVVG